MRLHAWVRSQEPQPHDPSQSGMLTFLPVCAKNFSEMQVVVQVSLRVVIVTIAHSDCVVRSPRKSDTGVAEPVGLASSEDAQPLPRSAISLHVFFAEPSHILPIAESLRLDDSLPCDQSASLPTHPSLPAPMKPDLHHCQRAALERNHDFLLPQGLEEKTKVQQVARWRRCHSNGRTEHYLAG